MDVGDLVWVRFAVYHPDTFGDFGMKWKLACIIKDDQYQAGLYKVYVFEYNKEQKIFINDMRPLNEDPTIYEDLLEGLK
jgi:hypothetical protein